MEQAQGHPEGTAQPVRAGAHSDCTVTPPASRPLGTAWNYVRQVLAVGAGAGAQRSSTGKHWYITSVGTSACTRQPD